MLALLPHDHRNATAEAALARLSDGASRRVVVVLAAQDRARAQGAAVPLHALLASADGPLQTLADGAGMTELIDFYAPYRDRLLDREQRTRLTRLNPEQIVRGAVQSLNRPGPSLRALGPLDDPTGSFSAWLSSRAAQCKVRPDGDWLALNVALPLLAAQCLALTRFGLPAKRRIPLRLFASNFAPLSYPRPPVAPDAAPPPRSLGNPGFSGRGSR